MEAGNDDHLQAMLLEQPASEGHTHHFVIEPSEAQGNMQRTPEQQRRNEGQGLEPVEKVAAAHQLGEAGSGDDAMQSHHISISGSVVHQGADFGLISPNTEHIIVETDEEQAGAHNIIVPGRQEGQPLGSEDLHLLSPAVPQGNLLLSRRLSLEAAPEQHAALDQYVQHGQDNVLEQPNQSLTRCKSGTLSEELSHSMWDVLANVDGGTVSDLAGSEQPRSAAPAGPAGSAGTPVGEPAKGGPQGDAVPEASEDSQMQGFRLFSEGLGSAFQPPTLNTFWRQNEQPEQTERMTTEQLMASIRAGSRPDLSPMAVPKLESPTQAHRPDLRLSVAALQQAALAASRGESGGLASTTARGLLQSSKLLRSTFRPVSRYRGITPHHGRWQARIKEARRDIHLGYFDTEEEAAHAYDRAVIKFRGREAPTNFCISMYEDMESQVKGEAETDPEKRRDCSTSRDIARPSAVEVHPPVRGRYRCARCGKPKRAHEGPPDEMDQVLEAPQSGTASPRGFNFSPSTQLTLSSPAGQSLTAAALAAQAGATAFDAYQAALASFSSELWTNGAPSPNLKAADLATLLADTPRSSPSAAGGDFFAKCGKCATKGTSSLLGGDPGAPEESPRVAGGGSSALATLMAMEALQSKEGLQESELFGQLLQLGGITRRKSLRRSSQYRGITRHHGRWQARIKDSRRDIHLGYFDTEEEAAKTYDRAALRFRGAGAVTNFPVTDYPPELREEGDARVREMSPVTDDRVAPLSRRKGASKSKGLDGLGQSPGHPVGPGILDAGSFIAALGGAEAAGHPQEQQAVPIPDAPRDSQAELLVAPPREESPPAQTPLFMAPPCCAPADDSIATALAPPIAPSLDAPRSAPPCLPPAGPSRRAESENTKSGNEGEEGTSKRKAREGGAAEPEAKRPAGFVPVNGEHLRRGRLSGANSATEEDDRLNLLHRPLLGPPEPSNGSVGNASSAEEASSFGDVEEAKKEAEGPQKCTPGKPKGGKGKGGKVASAAERIAWAEAGIPQKAKRPRVGIEFDECLFDHPRVSTTGRRSSSRAGKGFRTTGPLSIPFNDADDDERHAALVLHQLQSPVVADKANGAAKSFK